MHRAGREPCNDTACRHRDRCQGGVWPSADCVLNIPMRRLGMKSSWPIRHTSCCRAGSASLLSRASRDSQSFLNMATSSWNVGMSAPSNLHMTVSPLQSNSSCDTERACPRAQNIQTGGRAEKTDGHGWPHTLRSPCFSGPGPCCTEPGLGSAVPVRLRRTCAAPGGWPPTCPCGPGTQRASRTTTGATSPCQCPGGASPVSCTRQGGCKPLTRKSAALDPINKLTLQPARAACYSQTKPCTPYK